MLHDFVIIIDRKKQGSLFSKKIILYFSVYVYNGESLNFINLFVRSSTKFDSGCGWPAFNEACGANGSDLLNSSIEWKEDNSLDTHRTEVTCKNVS